MSHEAVAAILVCVVNAIAAMAQVGLAHCDLKPGNIMLSLEDGMPIIKVCGMSASGNSTPPDACSCTAAQPTLALCGCVHCIALVYMPGGQGSALVHRYFLCASRAVCLTSAIAMV